MDEAKGVAAWEYLSIPEADWERLAELGSDGWDLVAVGGPPDERVLYLKRPAPSFRERVTLDQRAAYLRSRGLDPRDEPQGSRA
jgi:hypothetical protein